MYNKRGLTRKQREGYLNGAPAKRPVTERPVTKRPAGLLV
jgi:hypothetical protein